MLAQQLIAIKRDGGALNRLQIADVVGGLVDGRWSDAQAAALAMAIVIRGMDRAETVALTAAMTQSGNVFDWRDDGFDGPVLDKHSTGGVGDKTSLVLAPLIAACGADAGAIVPMVSGRGLGHTGGTLDKLEALAGYRTDPAHDRLLATLRDAGCAIVGASATLAPADRRLYAIRDETATVGSVPLITASILSKKLAAGLGALVLDVKFGSGAMLPALADAQALADNLVAVAAGAGLPAVALLTDMTQVLGRSAGNAVEVAESIALLTDPDAADPRLLSLTIELGARLLVLGGVAASVDDARAMQRRALASGAAADRFARMVAALGGPRDVLRDSALPVAPVMRDVAAPRAGVVAAIDVRAIGVAVVALGGGRRRQDDRVDPRVGLTAVAGVGLRIGSGDALAVVHAASESDADAAVAAVVAAFTIADAAPAAAPLIADVVTEGVTEGVTEVAVGGGR